MLEATSGALPPRRVWRRYRSAPTAEAIVGAVTGPATAARALLLGRCNSTGMLHCTGRTTPLARAVAVPLAGLLVPAAGGHSWTGTACSPRAGARDVLDVALVRPGIVGGVVDVARDAAGRRRHPVRLHRARPDVDPGTVPLFST